NQLFLAQKFARMKQFERALIAIDNVLVQHPTFDRALSMKGSIYFAKGEFKESLVWYEKAIDVNPELQGSVEMASKVRKRLNLPQVSRNRKPAGG
ncbi:MAG: tetratricopeptide repeat protein, partial [Bdellovibrionales bacterium]|nr:tetratricopeptide repeat protein [Bdellovibrionales bacterium]